MSKEQFDEKMDELSREAALHQSLPYNEADWQSMEELLDKKEKRRRFIFWWWFTPLLMLLISTGIYWLNNSNKTINKSDKTTLASGTTSTLLSKNNNTETLEEKGTTEVNKNNSSATNKEDLTIVKAKQEEKALPKISSTSPASNNRTNEKGTTNKSVVNQSASGKTKTKNLLLSDTKISSNQKSNTEKKVTAADNYSVNQLNSNVATNTSKSTQVNTIKDSTISTPKKEKNIDTALAKVDTAIQKNEDKKITATSDKKKKNKSLLSKLELSINGSADMTTVKFKKADQLSTAYGIGITYYVNQRLSITSGIGIAKKLYNADSADYNKTMYLPWYSRLNNIKANCSVIEVPLNVQYSLATKNKSSWIAAAGISNYFMKTEEYIYEYTLYGVPKTATYNYSKRNNHLLSILNLAVAYRRAINEQFSWQISPYAKIPLTGIGEGKVQLSSLGVQVSIHFRLKK